MKKYIRVGTIISIALLVILILISFAFEIINENKRQNNLYNIENPIYIDSELVLPSVAIYNELVLDNFDGIDIEIDNSNVYRADTIVENTNNNLALDRFNNLNNLNIRNILPKDTNEFNYIKRDIFNKNFNNLDIDYLNGINLNKNLSESTLNYINSYLSNHSVYMIESGYLIDYYDGYESLLNIDNLNLDLNILESNKKELNKMTGLKYVDNKYYNIVTYVDDFNIIDKEKLKQIGLSIVREDEESDILQAVYQDTIILDKGYLLVFKLFDGIEETLDNRFFDIRLKMDKIKTYKIPKSSIVERNGIEGVLYLKGNIVNFTPIKIIKEDGDKVFISNDFSRIFTDTFNTNIDFGNLEPFTKIILDPKNYYEGEIY